MMVSQTREKNGRFPKGFVANSKGNNGDRHWQPYAKRAQHWMEKLSADQLTELVSNPAKFGKLSSYDAIIVRQLLNCFASEDMRLERKDLIDRIEGTPKQTVDLNGSIDAIHYMAHDQKIIDRYNAKRETPITIDNKPITEET
jgi:hypothetical protein